jgi:microcompartment protein CcmL/EutN
MHGRARNPIGNFWTDPEALAVVELASFARAFSVSDAMVKRADSHLWRVGPISPGKFLIILRGGVAEVGESYEAGLAVAGDMLVDSVFLPQVHPQVPSVIEAAPAGCKVDALAIVETTSCAAAIRAADAAVKAVDVSLVHMLLGRGIGGKAVFAFAAPLHDVQAGIEAARDAALDEFLVTIEEIPAPHGAMTLKMLGMGSDAPDY